MNNANMTSEAHAWICDICRDSFPIQISLLAHKVVAHRLEGGPWKLSQLLRVEHAKQTEILYSSDSDTEYHIVTHVYKVPRNKTKTIDTDTHDGDASSNPQTNFASIFCELNYDEQCSEPDKESLSDSHDETPPGQIIVHARNDKRPPRKGRAYICDYCGKSYARKNNLKRHMHQSHLEPETDCETTMSNGEYQHACSKCGKKMCSEAYRRNHELLCFTHLCSYCGKHFKNSSNLSVHIMSHTQERPFACTLCEKAFRVKRALLDHMNKHAGIKPYKCPYENCNKSFTLSTGVRQHMNSMHLAKRFTCSYCQHQFSTKFQLHCHERTHTGEKPYKCNYCERVFCTKMQVDGHERTHTGEKPYKCGVCSASFRLPTTFKKHQRVHTGERPYKCGVCLKGFVSSYNLKQHKKRQRQCTPPSETPLASAAESLVANE